LQKGGPLHAWCRAGRQGGAVYAALPDRYIVILHDDVAEVAAIASEHARRYGETVGHLYRHALMTAGPGPAGIRSSDG
jgi:hypothetical protein